MWLDDLKELVGRLGERIEKHRDVLSRNETATRYALIDPLLTALGWDLQDPGQVRTEYNPDGTRGRRADYTMFTGEDMKKPQIVIEAKKLGMPIDDEVISQTIGYCIREGIPYFAVTNGSDWEIYPTFGGAHIRITEKRIVDFKLTDAASTTVMKMLWLWRGNFESDSPIMPVVPDRPVPLQTVPSAPQPTTATPPSNVERSDRGIPLDRFNPSRKDPPPAALLFPGKAEQRIGDWYEIQVSAVRWLLETDRLTEADCPVTGPRGGYLVVASPFKPDGSKFDDDVWIKSWKQVDSNVRVNVTKDAPGHTRIVKSILKSRNVDLSDVRVVLKT